MAKRKKRLEKGIESIGKQIELHYGKKDAAVIAGEKELAEYYEKEISALEDRKRDREKKLRGSD
jgi:peptidoglycan hydrolase CwlO-like protein